MNILICLIGSNPLPNYIVTKYVLLDSGNREDIDNIPVADRVFFLYSYDTKEYAKNICKKLSQTEQQKILLLSLDKGEREKEKIQEVIINVLDKIYTEGDKIDSIHLNYTGGTKPMAVYSYLTVNQYAIEKKISLITSNLHPNTHRLKIDGGNEYPSGMTKQDLRQYVSLSISTLLELHSMEILQPGGYISKTFQIDLEKFKTNILSKMDSKEYSDLKKAIEELNKEEILKSWKAKEDFIRNKDGNTIKLLANKYDFTFLNQFRQIYSDFSFKSIAEMTPKDFINLVGFAGGQWLEEYIQERIIQLKENYGLTEIKRSVKAIYKGRDCEIDVLVNRGYQMYLFSCTTSRRISIVKGKAFEGMYRASQLGGDEAKAIIVHCMPLDPANKHDKNNNNKLLEKDLSSFDAKKRVETICLDDLKETKSLDEKLKEIFEG